MHDEVGGEGGESFVGNERESGHLEAERWGPLVPLVVGALNRMKMIYVRDLIATNFSLHGQKYCPLKHFRSGVS